MRAGIEVAAAASCQGIDCGKDHSLSLSVLWCLPGLSQKNTTAARDNHVLQAVASYPIDYKKNNDNKNSASNSLLFQRRQR